jgi:hypothetical protein
MLKSPQGEAILMAKTSGKILLLVFSFLIHTSSATTDSHNNGKEKKDSKEKVHHEFWEAVHKWVARD